uniref:Uncharacterized protein n=1 Tax=Daphnia galeata TaxID=27404 RepID=A0A8J2WPA6_9CRUS|nr:unnamed protein product [Daphnia galeata]
MGSSITASELLLVFYEEFFPVTCPELTPSGRFSLFTITVIASSVIFVDLFMDEDGLKIDTNWKNIDSGVRNPLGERISVDTGEADQLIVTSSNNNNNNNCVGVDRLCAECRMSSGVILNGGCSAENFTLATVEGHQEDPSGVSYNECWEPEDLVATVQFLATLDDRLPAYVMPSSSPEEQQQQQQHTTSSSVEENDEADVGNLGGAMDTMSSSVEEANEPMLPSSTTLHSFGDVSAPSVALSDITAEENSVSSAAQTPSSIEERSIIRTSNKPAHLKRVSFGSTKGSMVETLIYESPQHSDEGTSATPSGWNKTNVSAKSKNLRSVIGSVPESLPEETVALLSESARSASKVRVTYFESKRPLTLPSPEASDAEWDDMAEPPPQQQQLNYTRQTSTESGQDNPFRPDGDLSREADELVELLRGGRVSISEVLKNKEGGPLQSQPTYVDDEPQQSTEQAVQLSSSPPRNVSTPSSPPTSKAESPDGGRINGNLTEQEKKAAEAAESGAIEVQRGVVAPVAGESQVEHVVIKKKSKCQCCVIQ